MNAITELREQAARIATNARAKFDEIKADTSEDRAADIEREFDAMMADYDRLQARIERAEKIEAAEARANAGDPRRPNGDGEGRGDQGSAPDYKDVFVRAVRFGVGDLSSEERAILMQGRTNVPAELRAQAVGTDSAGGYLVPEGFVPQIDRAVKAWGPMWDADVVSELNTTSGADLPYPTVDDTAHSGHLKAENAAADDDGTDDATFGAKTLKAYVTTTGVVRVPLELLADAAFAMEPLMGDLFGERLGRGANALLTTGTGSSQPNGIVTASAAGKTAAGTAAVTSDELIDLQHSVDAAYRMSPKCRWQFNDTTLAAIRKLKDGQDNYLWQMGDVRAGEPNTLLGHPYSVNNAMASMAASAKPIIFGDHSRYVVRKVVGFQLLTLRERYAEYFQIGMIGFKRFDGNLLQSAAVKHLVMAAS